MVYYIIQMVYVIKDNSKIIYVMVMVYLNSIILKYIMVIGRMINCQDKGKLEIVRLLIKEKIRLVVVF